MIKNGRSLMPVTGMLNWIRCSMIIHANTERNRLAATCSGGLQKTVLQRFIFAATRQNPTHLFFLRPRREDGWVGTQGLSSTMGCCAGPMMHGWPIRQETHDIYTGRPVTHSWFTRVG